MVSARRPAFALAWNIWNWKGLGDLLQLPVEQARWLPAAGMPFKMA